MGGFQLTKIGYQINNVVGSGISREVRQDSSVRPHQATNAKGQHFEDARKK